MAHPIMFDEDDPFLARVDEIARGFPEVRLKVSHGRPAFYTQKVFVYYGGSIKVDGAYVRHDRSVVFRPEGDEGLALLEDPRVYVPAYLGPSGWLGLDLDERTDWTEVAELVECSYRLTAPRALVRELDAAVTDRPPP